MHRLYEGCEIIGPADLIRCLIEETHLLGAASSRRLEVFSPVVKRISARC
jgi:hypothetical protein